MGKRIAIVGAGLFGSIAAILATKEGHDVTLIDDAKLKNRPTGSAPAACLIKPGWIAGLGDAGQIGMRVLEDTFGLTQIIFKMGPGKTYISWLDPNRVLKVAQTPRKTRRIILGSVEAIEPNGVIHFSDLNLSLPFPFDAVLIAAGVWSGDLTLNMPEIRALAGIAFIFAGERKAPIIAPWAPYKQVVAFTREPGTTWISDGSAILEKNWTPERSRKCFERCVHYAPAPPLESLKELFGLRPYVVDNPKGYFKKIGEKTWVSTGGAKNGTVLAAYQALKFMEAIK